MTLIFMFILLMSCVFAKALHMNVLTFIPGFGMLALVVYWFSTVLPSW